MIAITDDMIRKCIDEIRLKTNKEFNWFLTGSCFYNRGVIDESSDIDIVIDFDITGNPQNEDYGVTYIEISGQPKLNVICKPNKNDFILWRKATEVIKFLFSVLPSVRENKNTRIEIFRMIVKEEYFLSTTSNKEVI